MINKYIIEVIMIMLWLYSLTLKDKPKEQTPEESKLIIEVNGKIKKYKSYDDFIKDLPQYNTIKLFVKGSTEAEKVKSILNIYYKNDYKIIKMDL